MTIKIAHKPKVYLVARPRLDAPEVLEFLNTNGTPGFPLTGHPECQKLIEIAARVCYMSFKGGRPHVEHLGHILEVGHGCYDEETDVLTVSGWKRWPDVTMDDRLATLKTDGSNQIEYHRPVRLVRYPYTGPMYKVSCQNVDLLVTPNHKMWACQTTTKAGRRKERYSLVSASDLGRASHAYLKSGNWICSGSEELAKYNPAIFSLLGFAIGDGSHDAGRQVRFHLYKLRKITWLRNLVDTLLPLGFEFKERGDHFTVRLPDDPVLRQLFDGMYDDKRQKKIPTDPDVLFDASSEQLVALFNGLIESDGHISKTCVVFDTTSDTLASQFQQLCLHVGCAANVNYRYTKENRPTSFGSKPLTRLGVCKQLRPEVNKWSGSDGVTYWVADWSGEVYCAEVPNNTLYVRRGGKPVWSGNSVLEHANFSFLITGISRATSHEMVRHRAGFSFSQLSQRFVDESEAEFVLPFHISQDAELKAAWLKSVTEAQRTYQLIADRLYLDGLRKALPSDVWADGEAPESWTEANDVARRLPLEKRTAIRKHARQTARSVLPNCTETKLVATANIRAIRHFLEMRGSIHADYEIRTLAFMIWNIMKDEAPDLFRDFHINTLSDGQVELVSEHRKV